MITVLTGFMGSGKTSAGKKLARLLAVPFIDLDEYIVERSGKTVPELFAVSEEHFRTIEAEYLRDILESEDDLVLALGGGAIMTPSSAALVKKYATCFYLKASTDTLISHLENSHNSRPLLSGQDLRARIEELMARRASTYEAAADHIVITDGLDPNGIAGTILSIITHCA